MDKAQLYRITQNKKQPNRTTRLAELVTQVMEDKIAPQQKKFGPIAEFWRQILPEQLQKHCRIAEISGGQLKVVADSPVYANEIKWCSDMLCRQLQINCPTAKIKKIKVTLRKL